MMRVFGGSTGRFCDGIHRRSFLQAGVLGLGGLTLPDLLKMRAEGAARSGTDTNVILLWLSGGPGHMETWDPKPNAVSQYRGPFGAIGTSVPGVQFGELLPEQAKIMDKISILRTVKHGTGDHTKGNHWMLTGFPGPDFNAPDATIQRRPAMGSFSSMFRGSNRPGMPGYVAVPHLRGGTDNFFHYAAYLGGGFNPFVVNSDPNDSTYRVRDLSLSNDVTLDRLESRHHLLQAIDQLNARGERQMSDVTAHQQRAFDLLTSPEVRDAFDISRESPALRDSYGRHMFGQSALLARRLVESGVTFVTVNCVPWDHHGTGKQLKTEEGAKQLIPPLDKAIAALVRDLIDRGLFEKTLVVAMGEFGRTPRMNSDAGRDHWGHTFSVLMAGGGTRPGQVIGKSSERGEYVVERPIDPQDVSATIYQHLGIDYQAAVPDRTGRPMNLLDHGEPIRELYGV